MQFLPLAREQAALHALLPMVLRREHTGYGIPLRRSGRAVRRFLGATVRKKGETQCVGFVGSFLDDAYTLDGSAVLEPSAAPWGSWCSALHPGRGLLPHDYRAKSGRTWSPSAPRSTTSASMPRRVWWRRCAPESPSGVDKLGDEASAAAITPQKSCGTATSRCFALPR